MNATKGNVLSMYLYQVILTRHTSFFTLLRHNLRFHLISLRISTPQPAYLFILIHRKNILITQAVSKSTLSYHG